MMKGKMPTMPGMSVRKEIDARLAAERVATRTETIEEVIDFLRASRFLDAALALKSSAFGPPLQGGASNE